MHCATNTRQQTWLLLADNFGTLSYVSWRDTRMYEYVSAMRVAEKTFSL
jgi:hypothetical protein